MKKLLLISAVILTAILAGCAHKTDSGKKPEPTPAADAQKSDTAQSDAHSSDVDVSSDVTESSDVQESDEAAEVSLRGAWQSRDKAYTFDFVSDNLCIYVADKVNVSDSYNYEDGVLTLNLSDVTYSVSEHTDKKLVLLDENGEKITLRKLSTKKGLTDLTTEELYGRWICHIDDNGTALQFEITLNDDMTAVFVMNVGGKEQKLDDVTWKITKKGMLILDNGTGSADSKLKYRIIGRSDDVFYIVMEGTVMCLYRVTER